MQDELRLMAYVDGELDADAAREVEALLAADPQARRLVEQYRQTASLLRAACAESFYADPPLQLPRPQRSFGQAWRRYGNLAAVAMLAIAVGFGGGMLASDWPVSKRERLVDEIAEYHSVQSKETRHLVEVPSSEVNDLTTWLGRRLDRRLAVPDLTPSGLHFAGGRMLVVDGKPVAEFMYTRSNGPPVALCIAHTGGEAAGVRVDRRDGMHLASWQDGQYTYVVAGTLTPAEARAIAAQAQTQLRT